MPADSSRAVFLSYASQDAEAARRICEALRGAGVEVWFDQSELRGGDAWDAKIRKQIKECAMFVPLISANTQSRREGYFRLEWKLADDRTALMARGTPFIVPLCIDETNGTDALVPDSFLAVQWTRLPGGVGGADFAQRVQDLLGEPALEPATAPRQTRLPERGLSRSRFGTTRKRRGVWIGAALVALVILVGASRWPSLFRAEQQRRPEFAGGTPASPAPPSVPRTKAQQFVAQARPLFESWDLANSADLALAQRLLAEAVVLEPSNAEAHAAIALLSFVRHLVVRGDPQVEVDHAQLAVKLDRESDYAKVALAAVYRARSSTREEGIAILRDVVRRRPDDRLALRLLGNALRLRGDLDEAMALFRQADSLPGGDVGAVFNQALVLEGKNQYLDALQVLDAAIAQRPDFVKAHAKKITLLLFDFGDLERAKTELAKMAPALQVHEHAAAVSFRLWLWDRQPDKALTAVKAVGGDELQMAPLGLIPKPLAAGMAHRMAGRTDAAQVELRKALALLEARIAEPDASSAHRINKAHTHALLGDIPACERELRLYEELRGGAIGRPTGATVAVYVALGRIETVMMFFEQLLTRPRGLKYWAGDILLDPQFDSIRSHPRFPQLRAAAEQHLAVVRGEKQSVEAGL